MFGALNKYAEIPPFVDVGYEPQTTFWGDFVQSKDYEVEDFDQIAKDYPAPEWQNPMW